MRNPFGREIILALVVAVAAVGIAVGAPLWPSAPGTVLVAAQVAPWVAAEALLMALYFVLLAVSFKRRTRRVVAGDYWVHWQFEADEWEFARKRGFPGDSGQSQFALIAEFLAALFILGLLLFAVSQGSPDPASFDTPLLALAGIGVLITLAIYFSGGPSRSLALGPDGDLYVSLSGVYLAGNYLPLDGLFLKLVEADVVPGKPAMLRMVRRYQSPWLMKRGPFPHEVNRELRIPVPAAHVNDAVRLAKRLLLNQRTPWGL